MDECIKLGEDKFQKHDAERCCGLSGCMQDCYFIDIVVLFCVNYVSTAVNVFIPQHLFCEFYHILMHFMFLEYLLH